jgi:hypothetical protein
MDFESGFGTDSLCNAQSRILVQKQKEMRMTKPFSVALKGWLLVMIPIVVEAGHHPGHGATESAGGGATLWIFLGLIAFVGIMALLGRKRK